MADCNTAMLREIESDIDLLTDVAEEIRRAIVEEPPFSIREGGFIKAGYNEEIDSLKAIMTDGTGVIASIEAQQREETGIPKLKVGYNRVFGYYIEVSNAYRDQVPETYIRKQTLSQLRALHNPGAERAGGQDFRRQGSGSGAGIPAVLCSAQRRSPARSSGCK